MLPSKLLAKGVKDIAGGQGREATRELATLTCVHDLRRSIIVRLSTHEDVEEDVRIKKYLHASEPYFSRIAEAIISSSETLVGLIIPVNAPTVESDGT